jgi:protein involved in polysaccharide export with SLBB domain
MSCSACFLAGGRIPIMRQLGCLFLVFSLAAALWAQTTGSVDCSDPLLADTYECTSQGQEGMQPQTQPGQQGGYNPYSENPSANAPTNPNYPGYSNYPGSSNYPGLNFPGNPNYPYSGNLPSNYSDLEQYWRQTAQQQAPLQPEPLTEFQKFVASTTGLILPIYGADLFRRIPSTFAPLQMTPVPPDYVVGPGDELRIRIWGQVNTQANVRVDRSGEVYLPQVGEVHVAGLKFSELDSHLRDAVGRVYRNFDLTVNMGQIRAIQVYVSGEARRPGVYTVSSLSTLVDALFASGGPSVEGSLRAIELRRGGTVVTHFDLYDLLIRGDKTKDAKLLDGDVIFIPPVGPEAAVYGSVRSPAIYELLPKESLADVLADAGGVSAVAAEARVSIERIDEHRDRQAMEVAYDVTGLATPLADGDTIRVYSILPKYQKTVTLRGNTANPGRFAWHEGMRISELIPDKDSLLTRNYWWRRTQLGLPAPDFEPAPNFANQRQPWENHPVTLPRPTSSSEQETNTLNPTGRETSQNPIAQDLYSSQQGQEGGPATQNPALSAQQRGGSAPLANQLIGGASQPVNTAQRTDVRLPAPEIDWDYAVIERINSESLKTELVPFDLGKLVLQHYASQDLELQPGDIVTIFSASDIRVPVAEQTKLVRLEGEFVHAGVYSARPGETLRELVARAGGLTPNAYLYGSEFTRVSTRAVQQARIDEYVQSLSMSIQRNSMALATSAGASAQGLAGSTAAQGSEQGLLASLRLIRATGRIVLPVQPSSSGVNTLPNISLEDGDRFLVPQVPATVNVVGAVYDQSSFLFEPSGRVGTYLRQSGGANKEADRRREFIIRADGEVVSRDLSKGLWGNEFDQVRIYPGDTIVVPEKIFKLSALYGVMNWSQLFSQFALGAAALDVVH